MPPKRTFKDEDTLEGDDVPLADGHVGGSREREVAHDGDTGDVRGMAPEGHHSQMVKPAVWVPVRFGGTIWDGF